MKQIKVVSVNAFARRFGLTRSAVIDRIRAGALVSQYDTRTKLYSIPTTEVERTRNEIIAEGHVLERQRANASNMVNWIDTLIRNAHLAWDAAEADLKRQTPGTKAHSVAQEKLDKAIAVYNAEFDLQTPYLVLAKRIEKAGFEFIERFNENTGEATAK